MIWAATCRQSVSLDPTKHDATATVTVRTCDQLHPPDSWPAHPDDVADGRVDDEGTRLEPVDLLDRLMLLWSGDGIQVDVSLRPQVETLRTASQAGSPTLSIEISVMRPTGAARSRSRMSVFAPGICKAHK